MAVGPICHSLSKLSPFVISVDDHSSSWHIPAIHRWRHKGYICFWGCAHMCTSSACAWTQVSQSPGPWQRGSVPGLCSCPPPQLSLARDPTSPHVYRARVCLSCRAAASHSCLWGPVPGLPSCRNQEWGAKDRLHPLMAWAGSATDSEHVGDLRKSRDQISLPLCSDSKSVCAIFSISACCWHSQRPAPHRVGWSAQGRGCVGRPSLTDCGGCCVPGTACPLHPCFTPLCYFTYWEVFIKACFNLSRVLKAVRSGCSFHSQSICSYN